MNVVDAIKMLRGFDRQFVVERDNHWSQLAELVETLAEHAEPSIRDSELFAGYREWLERREQVQ